MKKSEEYDEEIAKLEALIEEHTEGNTWEDVLWEMIYLKNTKKIFFKA